MKIPCQMLTAEQFAELRFGSGADKTLKWYESIKDSYDIADLQEYVDGELGDRPCDAAEIERLISRYFLDMFWAENVQFEFAGIGTSRIVFVDGSGVAVKFLHNGRSGQMEQEIRTSLRFAGAKCFPKILGYGKNMQSEAVEACRPATEAAFRQAYGFDLETTLNVVRWSRMESRGPLSDPANAYRYELFLDSLESSRDPRWASLRDFRNIDAELNFKDVDVVENWGVAVRNGVEMPVIIDIGL